MNDTPLTRRSTLLGTAAALWPLAGRSAAPDTSRRFAGHYPDDVLAKVQSLTLPRLFVYDKSGLIEQARWPTELTEIKGEAGDAFCCVSDTPRAPGASGPPPDCKVVVYGTDLRSNFDGLLNAVGQPINADSLPASRYLLVEYFATWCAPCVTGRAKLETFFRSDRRAADYVWVSIDMTRMLEAKRSARAAMPRK